MMNEHARSTPARVLVTGATGRVGGQVASQLVERADTKIRVLARDPETVPHELTAAGVEVAAGDLTRPDGLGAALDDVDAVFLVFPSVRADGSAAELVRKLAGHAGRIVYLSAFGVPEETAATPPEPDGSILTSHAYLEALIAASGVEWTFLRAGGFAANTLGWAQQVRESDEVRWFVPEARRSMVHEADLAAVGVRALLEAGWHGARPHLTGPEVLSQREQLSRVGVALGRELRMVELDADSAHAELFPDMPRGLVDQIVAGHQEMAAHPETVSEEVEQLTGRPALTYQRWAHDHVADFR